MKSIEEKVAVPVGKKRFRLLHILLLIGLVCAISSHVGTSAVETSVSSEGNIYNSNGCDGDDEPVISIKKNREDTVFDDCELPDEIFGSNEEEDSRESEENYDKERGGTLESLDIIVVAAVDGTLAGLSRETGRVLWKQSEKIVALSSSSSSSSFMKPSTSSKILLEDAGHILKPLIATTTTTQSASSASYTAIPSVDGTVYTTTNDVTTSTSVKDLVARAPFLDPRGRFFVGSRQVSAAALDGETGEVLRVVKYTQDENERSASSLPTLDNRNVVWIGRVDYLISVQDARTGMVEVQFSIAEIISVADMHGLMGKGAWKSEQIIRSSKRDSDEDGEGGEFSNSEQSDRLGLSSSPSDQRFDTASFLPLVSNGDNKLISALVATPNGNVALRDFDDDEKLAWVADELFDSPVVFAMDAVTGSVLVVDIIPDVPDPSASLNDLRGEMERQSNMASIDATPVVSAMSNGQLYALPFRRKRGAVKGETTSSSTAIVSTSSIAAAASSSNGAKHASQVVSHLPGRPNANFQQSDNSHNQNPQKLNQQHNSDHNPTGRHGTLAAKKTCVASSSTFPSCLINDHKILSEATPSLGNSESFMSGKIQRQFQQHDHSDASLAVTASQFYKEDGGFYHPRYGFVSPQDLGGFYHSKFGYVSTQDLYATQNRAPKNSYQKLFRVLGSWLPPTIALLFVVSFELGRRKRLNDEKQQTQNCDMKVVRDDRNNGMLSSTDRLDGEQQITDGLYQQEVISVSDDVLGYGGHGTVVYKGVLDGRNVAVKRMLKAYHASADREISLLIESDGDPNVVRYFLKEVRGDFVYLALELCDLSLHELIGVLQKDRQRHNKSVLLDAKDEACDFSSESMDATIRILLQIASGVNHLHSLRIVHRDLKPANILLAISKRGKKKSKDEDSILVNFVHNYYDAKISDMGLGKQLMGQSSIGASLVGESSFRGNKAGINSIGVGPGSVGWQAPEVMALRLTSDTSARSTDGTFNAADSKEHQSTDLQPSTQTSRSVDIFSLGCILYSLLIPGSHPYGEWFEREANIIHNRPNLDPLKKISTEAFYLISSMLDRNPRLRPTAKEVCQHPFFWNSQKKLAFLCDFSDRLETDSLTQTSSNVIDSLAIERSALDVIGTSWEEKLDSALIDNVQKFRSYDYSCVRDLLRLVRNKHHHFEELPEEFRRTIVPNQNALFEYFATKFPALVMHCYRFCGQHLLDDNPLVPKFGISPAKFDTKLIPIAPTSIIVEKTSLPITKGKNVINRNRPEFSLKETKINSIEGKRSEITDLVDDNTDNKLDADIIVWEGSIAAKTFNCRGWSRSQDEWSRHIEPFYKKRDPASKRCMEDAKFRTRLCNHWDSSIGTLCPMKKKNKCVFAHGPVELRVKEGKKNRWGKLVDKKGNNSNTWHSGGEDTFGAAFSIEKVRKEEGKWNGSKDRKSTGAMPKKKKYGTNQAKQKIATNPSG
mmetsp:Transcript_9215/g.10522  ORF Transcript_9215/g.10522 Transcript_9215/m.10522 type:complete len:1457 (+) Transcript_9215:172-4542(+)